MAFLFFQIIQVALIKIPVSLNQYPPKRIRTHCHPLGKWCRVTDQVEAFGDHFIIPKNRIDCHHFGMQVSNPNQAVTFYPIPDIILHIQMHRISSSLPYLIQAFVITSERTFVRDILKIEIARISLRCNSAESSKRSIRANRKPEFPTSKTPSQGTLITKSRIA